MSFLAPGFLIAAGAIAAAVVALHFIVTREPKMVPLPTARFAPDRPARGHARAIQPRDLLLMLLRVALILAVGAALARPVLRPPRRALARILLVDRSRAVAREAEAVDSARALLSPGDAVVVFDRTATVVRDDAGDTLAVLARSPYRGRLSAALIAGLRTASAMREAADSFELAIISPLAEEELDQAADSVRALWPGAVRLVRVAAATDTAAAPVVVVEGADDDPLRFALPSHPARARDAAPPTVRIIRGATSGADSAWVREPGRVLVLWPAGAFAPRDTGAHAGPALPPSWSVRAAPDTVGAVSANGTVVVAPFVRYAAYGGKTGDDADAGARVAARWVDGEPAAAEARHGAGCIRTVTIPVPSRGDLVLQPRFARLVAAMTAPCGGAASLAPIAEARAAALAGPASRGPAARASIVVPDVTPAPLVPWLLAAALAFAAGELLLRRRARGTSRVTAREEA
ncbi:MAG TPA: BatA domain-containing protein [Gemmatimonadaceae bacterium]